MADQPGKASEGSSNGSAGNGNGAFNGSGGPGGTGGGPSGVVVAFPGARKARADDVIGGAGAHRFRYHRESFRRTLAIAIGLTLAVCGLVWLLLGIYGVRHMNLLTLLTGLIFFAFVSARMLAHYFRNEVILAVQPTGLFDARIGNNVLPWDAIRELVLVRREQDYSLRIVMWSGMSGRGAKQQTHEVSLTALEGGAQPVLEAISAYMPVRVER